MKVDSGAMEKQVQEAGRRLPVLQSTATTMVT